MKQLPEGGHHAFVPRQWGVVNVNGAPRGNLEQRFFQNIGTGNGDEHIRSPALDGFYKFRGVRIADLHVRNAIRAAQLPYRIEAPRVRFLQEQSKDSRGREPRQEFRKSPHSIEFPQFFEKLFPRMTPEERERKFLEWRISVIAIVIIIVVAALTHR